MKAREYIKSALQQLGMFPLARLLYRRVNGEIRKQRQREIAFYSELLRPGSLVFDIGANLGQKSDVFLAAGFRSIILEPNRFCESSLNLQFSRNSNAVIDQRAVGSAAGYIDLFATGD